MNEGYTIAANQVEDEVIINRSRFICYLSPCNSVDAAKLFLQQVKALHPMARHHCYAFIADAPQNSQYYGYSDDGEPSGTAGKPMMNMLIGSNIGQICAVVVRYFGGIKLGTGGLQRAYGGSVKQALSFIKTKDYIPKQSFSLTCSYQQIKLVEDTLNQFDGVISDQQFAEEVAMTISLPIVHSELAQKKLFDVTSGKVSLKK